MSVVYHSSLKFYILPCVQSKKFGAVETNSVESKLFWVDLASLIIILFHLITHFFLALIFLIPAINFLTLLWILGCAGGILTCLRFLKVL